MEKWKFSIFLMAAWNQPLSRSSASGFSSDRGAAETSRPFSSNTAMDTMDSRFSSYKRLMPDSREPSSRSVFLMIR